MNSTHQPQDIVIVGAARTPFGRLLGGLSPLAATELGATAIRGALDQASIDPELVDAVLMGQVLQAGAGQNPAKQAARKAGLPERAHATTLNKVCLSGLSAIIDAARLLRSGEADVVVAGGMESMSNSPHLLPGSRRGHKFGPASLVDHMALDGLTDAELGVSMGTMTEGYADQHPASRAEQDRFSATSHAKAAAAWENGTMAAEVVPVVISGRKGETTIEQDEGIRPDSTEESLGTLRPAFEKEGTITAGNSSPISDGAAATVLTTRALAEEKGWPVLATVRAVGQVAGPDSSLQVQPANALAQALERQGWEARDLDVVEINEAFAAVGVCSTNQLGIDPAVVNPHGGAIALGHPIGASGARLVTHVAHLLSRGEAHRAGVALCGGGGQGEALLLEN
ncbi:acetyl-CoA C-acetyltransferase [Corynebacterium comes]|uniref:Probable acetyl-CoA acetyltransferase n=1 Tax=Corynebacterium comes TaxID=2675218 RepID=A0A6B8VQP0_9CORY|nr:acetyl-CoA C-acetyltransferase [Corynebacterium comes]QGU05379.1 putative acetyl-CoA acetyltransferase [Corynebacterium comes]